MITLNKACDIDFEMTIYRSFPSKAINLLQGLLEPDPSKRFTAEIALNHPYLTGIEPIITNPLWEFKAEDECNSEEDLKILVHNMESLRKMKKTVKMFENIRSSLIKETIPLKIFQEKEEIIEKLEKIEKMEKRHKKKLESHCSIIITRIPAITGHINSVASPCMNGRQGETQEDFSPVLRKEINHYQDRKKVLSFTLMATKIK